MYSCDANRQMLLLVATKRINGDLPKSVHLHLVSANTAPLLILFSLYTILSIATIPAQNA